MNQASREKIALIVFSITVVVFIAAVIAYIVLAHSWNIAARTIDEHRGAMEGYTVLVYSGNQDPSTETEAGSKDALSDGIESEASEVSEEAADAFSQSDSSSSDTPQPVSAESVVDSYLEKGASVLLVDSLDPSVYEGDDIYQVGSKRVGVFYASEGMSLVELVERVEFFADHNVSFLLCLTDDADFVSHAAVGIDAVVSLGPGAALPEDPVRARTCFVVSPIKGSVGAIMLSPDGVVSSKVHTKQPSSSEEESE